MGGRETAQELNNSGRINRETVADHARTELMMECMRKAEEIRQSLEGREHSDSTILIAENRKREPHLGDASVAVKQDIPKDH